MTAVMVAHGGDKLEPKQNKNNQSLIKPLRKSCSCEDFVNEICGCDFTCGFDRNKKKKKWIVLTILSFIGSCGGTNLAKITISSYLQVTLVMHLGKGIKKTAT